MTAAEVYESVTNGGTSDFAEVAAILEENGPWCLIGGLAINCYVDPLYTVDADMVVVASQLMRVEKLLTGAGFQMRKFAHSLNAQRGEGRLNIQFSTDPRYQQFIEKATAQPVLGVTVPVATLENLVQGKVWAWSDRERRLSKRKKDELDLIRVAEAYPQLRNAMPPEIRSQLET
jgi:hypothetical protein